MINPYCFIFILLIICLIRGKKGGEILVTKDMIINDVLRKVPGAMQVFIDSGIPCVG